MTVSKGISREEFPTVKAWLKARLGGIGASEAPAVMGVDARKSPYALYMEKTGRAIPDDLSEIEEVEWGKRLQPVVAAAYQDKTGRKVIDHGIHFFTNSELPFMFVSLDGEIQAKDMPGPGDLEIKCSDAYSEKDLEENLPLHWQVQIQHQIVVMNWQWASLAILLRGRRLRWIDIERNDNFIEVLLKRETEFWRRVVNQDPPDPDDSESTTQTLRKIYPRDNGIAIELGAEALLWDSRRIAADEEIKKWKKLKDEAENLLKSKIAENTFGVLPNGTRYSWRLQERKGFTVDPTEFRVLRRDKGR